MRRVAIVLLLIACAASAGDKRGKYRILKLDGKAIIPAAAAQAVPAQRPCESYAWAAALETILRARGVIIPQQQWAIRANGGDACMDSTPDYPELIAKYINGDYTPAAGQRIHLEGSFAPGPPGYPDSLIASMKRGLPLVMIWNGHAYVLYGMKYDEYVQANGGRIFEVNEFMLVDPSRKKDDPARLVSFLKEHDDPNSINGFLDVQVTERPF
jgi:hypothetical protein